MNCFYKLKSSGTIININKIISIRTTLFGNKSIVFVNSLPDPQLDLDQDEIEELETVIFKKTKVFNL